MEIMALAHPRLEVPSLPSQTVSVQVGTHMMVEKLPVPNGTKRLTIETTFIFTPEDDEDFSLLMELCDAVGRLGVLYLFSGLCVIPLQFDRSGLPRCNCGLLFSTTRLVVWKVPDV